MEGILLVLPLDAARASAAEGAVQSEVDVLLAVYTDEEGGHIHNLLAHPAAGPRSLSETVAAAMDCDEHSSSKNNQRLQQQAFTYPSARFTCKPLCLNESNLAAMGCAAAAQPQ